MSAYCVCERRGGESKREGEKEGGRACVCVCVRERVCERERERERERVCSYTWVCD